MFSWIVQHTRIQGFPFWSTPFRIWQSSSNISSYIDQSIRIQNIKLELSYLAHCHSILFTTFLHLIQHNIYFFRCSTGYTEWTSIGPHSRMLSGCWSWGSVDSCLVLICSIILGRVVMLIPRCICLWCGGLPHWWIESWGFKRLTWCMSTLIICHIIIHSSCGSLLLLAHMCFSASFHCLIQSYLWSRFIRRVDTQFTSTHCGCMGLTSGIQALILLCRFLISLGIESLITRWICDWVLVSTAVLWYSCRSISTLHCLWSATRCTDNGMILLRMWDAWMNLLLSLLRVSLAPITKISTCLIGSHNSSGLVQIFLLWVTGVHVFLFIREGALLLSMWHGLAEDIWVEGFCWLRVLRYDCTTVWLVWCFTLGCLSGFLYIPLDGSEGIIITHINSCSLLCPTCFHVNMMLGWVWVNWRFFLFASLLNGSTCWAHIKTLCMLVLLVHDLLHSGILLSLCSGWLSW